MPRLWRDHWSRRRVNDRLAAARRADRTALNEYCAKLGYDVERVVTVSELGPGTSDADIVRYAEREGRLLVTYDDDFLGTHGALGRIGVLFQPNDRTPPFETANIIDAVTDHIDQQQIVEADRPVHLTTTWL